MKSINNMLLQWSETRRTNYKINSELNDIMHLAVLNNEPGPRQFLGRVPVFFLLLFSISHDLQVKMKCYKFKTSSVEEVSNRWLTVQKIFVLMEPSS